jgi:GTP-binding protein
MLDEELMQQMKKELPRIPSIFISSATQFNIQKLKDKLWELVNG